MILADFLRLTIAERAEHVFHFGNFLECCQDRGNLYDMGGFYAEVIYNHELNEIQNVTGFQDISGLEPYLTEINI
ncbi:hypothetical protein HUW51_00630 (plasmid) [Adhaeribacter swui]|uniref:Uncharacterized protein n=2 Tax=Adhaeribacter TaxID=299566 RepID=A0A2T2Y8W3_9BACT|nr:MULTISPECIES: hypothetical protein [Adhaeribacter]PSR51936.1 hypothetical protein AHMF7605_28930 [Adhaeribacter arboris]QNF31294.1 hypothetical protein HUW51_00630 [Adhaeribacter swui]